MSFIQIYLLTGLVVHKGVWEVMKRRRRVTPVRNKQNLKTRVVSGVKVVVLLALVVQTFMPTWFPISAGPTRLRVAGIALYTAGLLVAIIARIQLGLNWSDIEKSRVVEGHQLVSRGIYGYVRHPIYTGDLMLLAGFELALNSWAVVAVALLALYVRRQAIGEEKRLQASLRGYDRYCRETSRFLPGLTKKQAAG